MYRSVEWCNGATCMRGFQLRVQTVCAITIVFVLDQQCVCACMYVRVYTIYHNCSGCLQTACLRVNTTVDSIEVVGTVANADSNGGNGDDASSSSSSGYKLVITHHKQHHHRTNSRAQSTSTSTSTSTTAEYYDAIVIAAPLESSKMTLVPPLITPLKREYVSVHTTVVTGVINGTFFGPVKQPPRPSKPLPSVQGRWLGTLPSILAPFGSNNNLLKTEYLGVIASLYADTHSK